jgi:hypothetical protein
VRAISTILAQLCISIHNAQICAPVQNAAVKRNQDIDSQPPRHPVDPIEITWTEKRLVLASPQQRRLFHRNPEHLR